MSSGYFLGVDVGSASVRAGVFDANGTRLAFATLPISQFRPGPQRVEQSSAEIWQQVCHAVKDAVSSAGFPSRKFVHWDSMPPALWLLSMNKDKGWRFHPVNRQTITSSCGWIIARQTRPNALTPRRIPPCAMLAAKSASKWNCLKCCG